VVKTNKGRTAKLKHEMFTWKKNFLLVNYLIYYRDTTNISLKIGKQIKFSLCSY